MAQDYLKEYTYKDNPYPEGTKEHQIWHDAFGHGMDTILRKKAVEGIKEIRRNRDNRKAELQQYVEHHDMPPNPCHVFRTADNDDCYEQLLQTIADWWSKIRANKDISLALIHQIQFHYDDYIQEAYVEWEVETLEEAKAMEAIIIAQHQLGNPQND